MYRLLAAIALFCGSPAIARQEATPAPAAAPPGAAASNLAPKPDKKICRSEVDSGSIMSHKTCHTKAEWAQIDAANARGAADFYGRRPAQSQ